MLERLWAGWRNEYVTSGDAAHVDGVDCVFCGILRSGLPDEETYVLWRGERTFAILKRWYGYTRVRYRRLARNALQLQLLCVAMNLRRALVLSA